MKQTEKVKRKLCSSCRWKHYTDRCERLSLLDAKGIVRCSARFARSKKGPCANGELWEIRNETN